MKNNPTMFSFTRSNKDFYEGIASKPGGFAKLTKYAKERGVDVKGKKKEELIEELLKQDEKE